MLSLTTLSLILAIVAIVGVGVATLILQLHINKKANKSDSSTPTAAPTSPSSVELFSMVESSQDYDRKSFVSWAFTSFPTIANDSSGVQYTAESVPELTWGGLARPEYHKDNAVLLPTVVKDGTYTIAVSLTMKFKKESAKGSIAGIRFQSQMALNNTTFLNGASQNIQRETLSDETLTLNTVATVKLTTTDVVAIGGLVVTYASDNIPIDQDAGILTFQGARVSRIQVA